MRELAHELCSRLSRRQGSGDSLSTLAGEEEDMLPDTNDKGDMAAGAGGRAGSRRRKRPEVCVSIDREHILST